MRYAVIRDLPRMVALDQELEHAPWGANGFAPVLAPPYRSWVTECGGMPVAYLVAHIVAGEAELLRLAVAPAQQRRGMASTLLQVFAGHLQSIAVGRCFLEVRRSNAAAIACYRRGGFVDAGIRRNYYAGPHGREDALLMQLTVPGRNGAKANDPI